MKNEFYSGQIILIIFSRKTKKVNHSPIISKNIAVVQNTFQKHLGVILDFRFTFDEHLKNVESQINKTIGLLRHLRNTLPRPALMTTYIKRL